MDFTVKLVPYSINQLNVEVNSDQIPDGVSMIQAPTMWNKGFLGQNTVVAVIDTGVDFNHPDLKDNIIGGFNFTSAETYMDDNGHGTHVAGIIAAASNNIGLIGVAPQTKILALKVLDANGSGTLNHIIDAITYASYWTGPNGETVNVISMSLGGRFDDLKLHEAVQTAVSKQILVVCAAGNDGNGDPNNIQKSYPGYYNEVVSVGAFDGSGHIAYFSDSNDQVDLVAPGYEILSTYKDGGYAKLSGTSMATPHVSGAAAVIISLWKSSHQGNMLESDLYAQMVKRAEELPGIDERLQGNGFLVLTKDVPRPTSEEIDILTAVHGLSHHIVDGIPTIASPEFWINMLNKFHDGKLTNKDFVYVDKLIRNFYRTIL